MNTETITKSDKKVRLAALIKERARINNEIARLTNKPSENEEKARKIGYIYYMHSKYMPARKNEIALPRVSIAAYVDTARKELCYGVKVWTKGFNRKVSRAKALGKALSTQARRIARLDSTDKGAVLDRIHDLLQKAELTAIQNFVRGNKSLATPAARVKVGNIVKEQLSSNGAY